MQMLFIGKRSHYFSKAYLSFETITTGGKPQRKLIFLLRGNTFGVLTGIRVKNMPRSVFIEGNTENFGICYQFGNKSMYLQWYQAICKTSRQDSK